MVAKGHRACSLWRRRFPVRPATGCVASGPGEPRGRPIEAALEPDFGHNVGRSVMTDTTVAQTTIAIDADIVKRAVEECFAELAPVRAEHFGQGWDFHMYLVNDRYLFRFPKRPDSFKRMRREQAVLGALWGQFEVPVPRFEFLAERSGAFDGPFAGYEKLPGALACHVDRARVDQDAVLGQAASLLRALGRAPVAALERAGLAREPEPSLLFGGGLDEVRRCFEASRTALPDPIARELRALLEDFRDVSLPQAAPRLVHRDLTSVHLLVDEATGRLSGVIDWGDVAIDHPVFDLLGWYGWLGGGFVERLLRELGATPPDRRGRACRERLPRRRTPTRPDLACVAARGPPFLPRFRPMRCARRLVFPSSLTNFIPARSSSGSTRSRCCVNWENTSALAPSWRSSSSRSRSSASFELGRARSLSSMRPWWHAA